MAKNLLEKLNLLVQASIRDVVGNSPNRPSHKKLGKDLKGEVAKLRQQLEAAFQDEMVIEQQLRALDQEILGWDKKADAAVLNKRDADARYAIQQMTAAKQRYAILQSELDNHRYASQELLRQVNQLDGLIELAEQPAEQSAPDTQTETNDELSLSQAIQQARQSVQREANQDINTEVVRVKLEDAPAEQPDEDMIEADLSARRSRLAKPE